MDDKEYKLFRSWVPLRTVCVDQTSDMTWSYYEYGPEEVDPIVFLPAVKADVFYKQFLSMVPKGYRVLSVFSPPYYEHSKFITGFARFLDARNIQAAHIVGEGLGGYLAQCFLQYRPKRVKSLVLINSFSDTSYFVDHAPCAAMFQFMPRFYLESILLERLPRGKLPASVAVSVDFVVETIETMSQDDLAARLTLTCTKGPLRPTNLSNVDTSIVTVIDCADATTTPHAMREEVMKFFPGAREAQLKYGGNFPYLACADDVNLHLEVHMRRHGVFPNLEAAASWAREDGSKSNG